MASKKELTTDELMVGVLTVIDQLQLNVASLLQRITVLETEATTHKQRISALETVVAEALPNFNSSSIIEHILKQKELDYLDFKSKLVSGMAIMGYATNVGDYQNIQISLALGSKIVDATIQLKKPLINLTYSY